MFYRKRPFLSRFSKVRYYFPLVILMAKRAGVLTHGENSCVRRMAVRKTSFLPAILVLFLVFPCWAETFSGKVVAVTDGDTIKVMHQGRTERVRLEGIDCPEKHQTFGKRAKHCRLGREQGSERNSAEKRPLRPDPGFRHPAGRPQPQPRIGAGGVCLVVSAVFLRQQFMGVGSRGPGRQAGSVAGPASSAALGIS